MNLRLHSENLVSIKPINKENWYSCTQLSVSEEQKQIFPVSVVEWMADAKYEYDNQLILFAIYNDNEIVGIIGYIFDPEDGCYWINPLMVDQRYQRMGYGREAVMQMLCHIAGTHGASLVKLGHRKNNYNAAKFYESVGFKYLEENEKEIIRCINISDIS